MNLCVRSARTSEDRPLLDLLPDLPDDRRVAFVRGGEGLVGWGVAARIDPGTGPGRFVRADHLLRGLAATAEVEDLVGLPGSGLVGFGSFDFDGGTRGSVLIIPRVVVGRRDGVTWRTSLEPLEGGPDTEHRDQSGEQVGPRDADPDHEAAPRPAVDRRPRFAGSSTPDAAWIAAVDAALAEIDAGAYAKVVLARDQRIWARDPFDTTQLLHRLEATFPSCTTFLVDRLLGASPETLLERRGPAVRSLVLAGTAPRGGDAPEDAALGVALLASAKDRAEHALAVASVAEVLTDRCGTLEIGEPSLLRLDNVQHLATGVAGRTRDGARSLELVGALHPSAAVGGTPRGAALDAIRRLEGMDRDRYAAPVGWTDAAGDGEWAIALRCALIEGDRARLFAGAGVVAESLPEAELAETWYKLRAMQGVLSGE